MSIWLKLLPLELQEISTFKEPTDTINSTDTVVGDMTDDLKRLYTLSREVARAAAEAQVEAKFAEAGEREQLMIKYCELVSKASVLRAIFMVALHDEFHLWGNQRVADVRLGFKVVTSPPPPMPDGFQFFRRMMGEDD